MARVFFSNHGRDPYEVFIGFPFDSTFVHPLVAVGEASGEWERDVFKATHAIVHLSFDSPSPGEPAELDMLKCKWEQLPEEKRNDIILLLVSDGGQVEVRKRPHERITKGRSTMYVLGARDQSSLETPEVVTCFYQMAQSHAEAVYEGRLTECPHTLCRLFKEPASLPKFLHALVILCQGFLAVQCGPDGDGDIKVEVPDPVGKIADAVRTMKWAAVMQSGEAKSLLDSRLTTGSKSNREGMRAHASSSVFWNVFDGMDAVKLIEAAGEEWRGIPGGKEFGTSATQRLIEILPLEKGSNAEDGFAATVADALTELASRLGGA